MDEFYRKIPTCKISRNLIKKTLILVKFQGRIFYQNPSKKVADVDFSCSWYLEGAPGSYHYAHKKIGTVVTTHQSKDILEKHIEYLKKHGFSSLPWRPL